MVNEIDFIADADESAIFGECKWSSSEIGLSMAHSKSRLDRAAL